MLATAELPSSEAPRTQVRSLGYDFAMLGLRARESRVEVIREAASTTAYRIQRASLEASADRETLLSDLATSTYRLLDPRKRGKLMERVQLSIFSESDFERQQLSREPLFAPSLVTAEFAETDVELLRVANQEFVQHLLERSAKRKRVGAVTTTLLGALGVIVLALRCLVSA